MKLLLQKYPKKKSKIKNFRKDYRKNKLRSEKHIESGFDLYEANFNKYKKLSGFFISGRYFFSGHANYYMNRFGFFRKKTKLFLKTRVKFFAKSSKKLFRFNKYKLKSNFFFFKLRAIIKRRVYRSFKSNKKLKFF